MICQEKHAYPHRMAAEWALALTRMQGRRQRNATAEYIYPCRQCGRWHLSSLSQADQAQLVAAKAAAR